MPRAVIWCAVSTAAQAQEDKTSLDAQESDGRAAAEREGLEVIEVLRVPGHSRRYLSLEKCAEDMLAAGINAFTRLIELWESRGFDVLIVRDGDRFARTQSLHLRVVEETIQAGARILSLADGWVDQNNYRLWGALNSYKAASEIDQMQKRRMASLRGRVASGLPWATPLFPFVVERDPRNGRALRMIIDESQRGLLNDIAALILDGIAWDRLPAALRQLGHAANPNHVLIYNIMYSPMTWGHMAFPRHGQRGRWAYDESVGAPSGITVWRGTHPPVFEGELAERLKEELNRRKELRGRAKGDTPYIFSGLLLCESCRRTMTGNTRKPSPKWKAKHALLYYRCVSKWKTQRGRVDATPCSAQKNTISTKTLQVEVGSILAALVGGVIEVMPQTDSSTTIQQVRAEIERTEESIRDLIQRQAAARANLKAFYDEQINALGDALEKQRARLQSLLASNPERSEKALENLRQIGVQGLWLLEPHKANQLLKVLMGRARFLIREGHVVGVSV